MTRRFDSAALLASLLFVCCLFFVPSAFADETAMEETDDSAHDELAITSTMPDESHANSEESQQTSEVGADPESSSDTEDGEVEASPETGKTVLSAQGHVADVGWQQQESVDASEGTVEIGTTGKSKALEAIKTGSNGELNINGEVLSRGQGWLATDEDGVTGTTGKASPIEAVVFRLSGKDSDKYQLRYRVHVSNVGWLDWAKADEIAGAPSRGEAIEAIRFWVALISAQAPDSTGVAYLNPAGKAIVYRAHVANVGWMERVGDGATAGTVGQSRALEALVIESPMDVAGTVVVEAHVANIGWMEGVQQGKMAGTTGRSLHMEALKIYLTGALEQDFDIYYRVHAANYGWLAWTSNGAEAGSTALSQSLEAIQILLIAKDASATDRPSLEGIAAIDRPDIQYVVHVQEIGWQTAAGNGSVAGTTGQGKSIEALQAWLKNSAIAGGISYELHLANIGWQGLVSDGAIAGTTGQGINAEAVKLSLTGKAASYFDIYYRAHSAEYGWLDWAKNGAPAGTTKAGYSLQALQIVIVGKGAQAPGSTSRPYAEGPKLSARIQSMLDRAQGFSSSTGWLVLVNRSDCHVAVFSGGRGNWNLYDDFACVVGASSSPTITGTYATQSRRPSLDTDSRARYCTQIHGGYFFHTILSSNSELGHWASHGCVRLPVEKARWIYYNLPLGSTVNIY